MATVWAHSEHSGTELLLLLAIADFADDDGRAYPSIGTLARKCRMSSRNVNHLLPRLTSSGELTMRMGGGPHGTNVYRVNVNRLEGVRASSGVKNSSGVKAASSEELFTTPEAAFLKPLKPASPKPSGNHQVEENVRKVRASSASGHRIPDGWTPSDADTAYCRKKRPDLDPDTVAEDFSDYWLTATGSKALKANWSAAFRRWVRKERLSQPVSGPASALSADEQFTPEVQ